MKSIQLSDINLLVDTIATGRHRIIIDEPIQSRISAAVLGQQISEQSFFEGAVSATSAEVLISKDISLEDLCDQLKKLKFKPNRRKKKYSLPVYFEAGSDWEQVEAELGLSKQVIIKMIKQADISVASFGFLPGFVYLDGLPTEIHCKRKSIPAHRVPAGAFGLGGPYAGIYHIPSPGGWNILGNCPIQLFDSDTFSCPLKVNDRIVIKSIKADEYEKLKANPVTIETYQKK